MREMLMNTPAADVQGTAALLHICCNLPLRTLYIRGSKYALMAGMGNNTHRATKRRMIIRRMMMMMMMMLMMTMTMTMMI